LKQSELEWFRPLWLRGLVTGLVALWFGWETFINQDQMWMLITGAALAYAIWNLFIKYPKAEANKTDGNGPDKPAA